MESALAGLLRPLLESGEVATKEDLQRAKMEAARVLGLAKIPTDAEVARLLGPGAVRRWGWLRTKPTRTESGVAVIAVMSSPASCPHGKCSFCPGGPEVDAPQSYTGFEPSTLRARRHEYHPARIVVDRLAQLARNGHAIDKLEVVIQGGTFPAREESYQDWFVAGLYAGANGFPEVDAGLGSEKEWRQASPDDRRRWLDERMLANESAACRVVGLTMETKPDWCFEPHVERMLSYGATRVEIGLQALDDAVLLATHRGHTLADSRRSLQVARDAGLKVCVHLMPGLPRGKGTGLDPDPEADVEDFRRLFTDPDYRPDMLKVYPTLVVQEGETLLKRQFESGLYHPYDSETAARVVAAGVGHVPEWCRIQRVERDIPTTHVVAGVMNSNLRQLADRERERQGLPPCRCIRCREVSRRGAVGAVVEPSRVALVRREYDAGGGREVFLSFEDPVADAVVGFLRLRRAPQNVAIVRELKVYGTALALGDEGGWQHQGFGGRLLAVAEEVAFQEWQAHRLLVIAGVGVKEYYRRHGYVNAGAYVAKNHPGS
ncbi:MAG: tRNA uridine(34) 5-carboxymethylaminomethyl modification radical SAM/GNAT enzyme Elp3 [Thermoplasmatota archaeon]